MSVVKLIGRKTDFRGKTLWEIVGNLKNFGVGRVVVRNMFERYPEKSFMRILKVEAVPNEEIRKVKVTVEKTFRGVTSQKPVVIFSSSYKADFKLIPKDEEAEYCKVSNTKKQVILSPEMDLPPLLREFVIDETKQTNPRMKVHFKENLNKLSRLAKEGEKPNLEVPIGLGTPVSPKLYENCL
ncbi:MRPS34 family protein [Megaselia abdita]